MDFQILRVGDFGLIEAGRGKARQRIERATLQQLGQRALQRHLEARMRAEAGEAALVLRVQQGHVHHRIAAAERGVLHQDAEARLAQAADAGGDVRIAGDHGFGHVGQAQAFLDDAELDVAFEDFGQRLGARLLQRVAGRHAVADVEVADEVDREIHGFAVAQPLVGDGADAAFGVAGIEVDQLIGAHAVRPGCSGRAVRA